MKLRICFEIDGLGEDEDGNPVPAGLAMTLGETQKQFDYWKFVQNISIEGVLKAACLDGFAKPEDVRIITPEEYDLKHGDDADEETDHEPE